jgi:class 3 adenylate cyclase
MFTDIVGYTALMAESEEKCRRVRERHVAIVRPLVERYHGQWIDQGDVWLSSFPSALDAVNCALAVQAELVSEEQLEVRIGIHLHEVVFEGNLFYGEGIDIAARVTVQAQPGGVAISKQVHDSVQGRTHLEFGPPREINFPLWPFTVYSVHGDPGLPEN